MTINDFEKNFFNLWFNLMKFNEIQNLTCLTTENYDIEANFIR